MVGGVCDIDKQRPAMRTVLVRQGEREMELQLCEYHYGQLRLQQEPLLQHDEAPEDSLEDNFAAFLSQLGFSSQADSDFSKADIQDLVSTSAKASIHHAAQTAVTFGRRELDTEHLLHALTGTDAVKTLLGSVRQKGEDIRTYIETNALRTDRPAGAHEPIELTVSPHMKSILNIAIRASQELGKACVGPEHLLIGIAQEPEGLGGEVLRARGLTAKSLRQKTMQQAKG